MRIIKTGWNPFVTKYNTNYPKAVQDAGGIEHLVKTNIGRNMWAIMVKFNVLPNDPRLRSLSVAERDFILLSMKQDNIEARRASLGLEAEGAGYEDAEMREMYDVPEDEFEVIHGNQNPDDIYRQVQEMTADPEYEMKLQNAIDSIYTEKLPNKMKQLKAIDEYQAEQVQYAQERAMKMKQEQAQEVDFSNAWVANSDNDWDNYVL